MDQKCLIFSTCQVPFTTEAWQEMRNKVVEKEVENFMKDAENDNDKAQVKAELAEKASFNFHVDLKTIEKECCEEDYKVSVINLSGFNIYYRFDSMKKKIYCTCS